MIVGQVRIGFSTGMKGTLTMRLRSMIAIAAIGLATTIGSITSASTAKAGTVGVFGERFSLGVIDNFYDGLAGHSSSILGSITGGALSGIDLLWAVQPSNAYTGAELTAMQDFLGGGGRIAFMGEHGSFAPNENNRINAALSAFGSTMSIINELVDIGVRTATVADGQILNHPLTAGVNRYDYAAFAPLSMGENGIALMLGEDDTSDIMMGFENIGGGSIFLITDQNVWDTARRADSDNEVLFENLLVGRTVSTVPLPAAGWMMIAGLAALGFFRRRAGMRA